MSGRASFIDLPTAAWTGNTLVIVCACATLTALVCVATLLWFRSRRQKREKLKCILGLEEVSGVKSAPASRMNSPKLSRRTSCPSMTSPPPSPPHTAPLSSSMSSGTIPNFTLPERVQPVAPRDPSNRVFNFSASQKYNDVGAIKPELYNLPSSTSPSDDDSLTLNKSQQGRLWFSLVYDAAVGHLLVKLVKVKDLTARSNQSLRDPFVKIFLLPDEKSALTSKVKKKTLSPIYNETHTFQVSGEDIESRVLRFSVYDVDKRRVRHSLGHVMVPLKGVDLTTGDVTHRDLESMMQAASCLGELQVSLAYFPQNDKVKVGIHRGRNLQGMDDESEVSTYVKTQLYYGNKNIRSKRTSSKQTSREHAVNESVTFTVAGKQLGQCSLVISMMVCSQHGKDEEYGRVVIGPFMYARGEELVHWQEMVARPKVAATKWHTLQGKETASAKCLHFTH